MNPANRKAGSELNEDQLLIQNVINELLRIKKGFFGPQGCSIKHQQANLDKATALASAVNLLKAYQELV